MYPFENILLSLGKRAERGHLPSQKHILQSRSHTSLNIPRNSSQRDFSMTWHSVLNVYSMFISQSYHKKAFFFYKMITNSVTKALPFCHKSFAASTSKTGTTGRIFGEKFNISLGNGIVPKCVTRPTFLTMGPCKAEPFTLNSRQSYDSMLAKVPDKAHRLCRWHRSGCWYRGGAASRWCGGSAACARCRSWP